MSSSNGVSTGAALLVASRLPPLTVPTTGSADEIRGAVTNPSRNQGRDPDGRDPVRWRDAPISGSRVGADDRKGAQRAGVRPDGLPEGPDPLPRWSAGGPGCPALGLEDRGIVGVPDQPKDPAVPFLFERPDPTARVGADRVRLEPLERRVGRRRDSRKHHRRRRGRKLKPDPGGDRPVGLGRTKGGHARHEGPAFFWFRSSGSWRY